MGNSSLIECGLEKLFFIMLQGSPNSSSNPNKVNLPLSPQESFLSVPSSHQREGGDEIRVEDPLAPATRLGSGLWVPAVRSGRHHQSAPCLAF